MPNGFDGDGPPGPDDGPIQGPKIPDPFVRKYWPFFIGIPLVVIGVVIVDNRFGLGLSYGTKISVSEPTLTGNKPTGTFTLSLGWFGIDSDQTGGACLVADVASLMTPKDAADQGVVFPGGSCKVDGDCMTHCATEPQCDPNAPHDPTDPTKPLNPSTPRQNWWGYCAAESGQSAKRCWYKPVLGDEKQLCEKSPYYKDPNDPLSKAKVWTIGVDNPMPHVDATTPPGTPFDVQGFYRDHTAGRPARWRLVGRVNATNGPPSITYGKPACLKTSTSGNCAK